jgi:pyruvate formate lyase activating enzyme
MKISGFLSESFQDWNGLTSVIFTGSCTYNCPACYAGKLVRAQEQYSGEELLKRLERKKQYIKKVVICGGEPTMNEDLPEFLKKLKSQNFLIKLDTNGTKPEMIKKIIEENLVDYIAMDIKGPKELYPILTGRKELNIETEVERGMILVGNFKEHEFRTTLFPFYDQKNQLRWMNEQEIKDMAKWITERTQSNNHLHYFQKFTARTNEEMIDSKFSKENLPKEYQETPNSVLEKAVAVAAEYLANCKAR